VTLAARRFAGGTFVMPISGAVAGEFAEDAQ